MKNGRVPKEPHVEKTTKAKLRPPEPAMERPASPRERGRSPALAHLHHSDPIPFLDQAVGTNAAPKAGSDHDEIKVEYVVVSWHMVNEPTSFPHHLPGSMMARASDCSGQA